ncbi:exosome complex component 10-like [Argopecten irradians]|uniref:exosome complex component 10-like n=1 Tax=Argopecten irradians TaxID=31199 RepID=UPI00371F24FB
MATPMQTSTIETTEEFLPGIKDVTEFTQKTLRAVLQATKSSNDLPAAGDDFDYYSSFQSFRDILDIEGKRILHIVQNVMQHQNVRGRLSHGSSDVLDLEDKFDVLTDANDQILERVGSWLDEASGIKKKDNTLVIASAVPKQQASTSWNKKKNALASKSPASYHLLSAKNILRPQLRFKDKIDNGNLPFIPRIKEKPNAIKCLEDSMKLPDDVTPDTMENPSFLYPHPYQYELDHWTPRPDTLTTVVPIEPRPLEETPLTMVSNVSELVELCDKLKTCRAIAVDLEHHSYRTFQGILYLPDHIKCSVQNVMQHQNVRGRLSHGSSDVLDLEDKFDVLTDANDQILERVGSWLDEASGIKKKDNTLVIASAVPKQQASTSWNKKKNALASKSPASYHLLSAKNILRPQLRFKDKIDNGNLPFIPRIKEKPNAIKCLEDSMKLPDDVTPDTMENPSFLYPHPYQYELDHWTPRPDTLTTVVPIEPRPLEETPLTMVSNVSELVELCDKLKTCRAIAVDLEHHSYRTFQGILCLMQISTRDEDFIVDTLKLRSDLHLLNSVFTDPNIVKVFHGADLDIDWLQRDLSLYVVNMFDTGQASRVLNLARFSLAHILKQYCGVEADKQYQLADWRIRPLPKELISYAREDTHYLLYLYDKMKNELIERGNEQKNLLTSVFNRSKDICAKVYKKHIFKEDDYLELYHKSKKVFNSQQLHALKNLYKWRDQTGRREDESLGYVLPNHMLLQIVEILPRERQGVLACCNPIPPLVRQYLPEVHSLIAEAREKPLAKVTKRKVNRPSYQQHPKYDGESLLLCPHDLSHQLSQRVTDPSVMLPDPRNPANHSPSQTPHLHCSITLKSQPDLSVYSTNKMKTEGESPAMKIAAKIHELFVSPFEKYFPVVKNSPVKTNSNANSSGGIQLIDMNWKLVKNTVKRKLPEEKAASSPAPGPPAKRQKKEEKEETEQEETPRKTLSQILKEKYSKLQKAEKIGVKKDLTEADEKKKKKVAKSMADLEDSFQPYDYSKADSSMFQGGSAASKSKVYNPNRYFGSKGKLGKGKKPKLSSWKSNKGHSFKDKK